MPRINALAKLPTRLNTAAVRVDLKAGGQRVPRFRMIAYTGGPMKIPAVSDLPVVIDLSGLSIPADVPILKNHKITLPVGHSERVAVVNSALVAEGLVSGAGKAARGVVKAAKQGFRWQASVGVDFDWPNTRTVKAGAPVKVNGQTLKGPLLIVQAGHLREISFVAVGADRGGTSATIAARSNMPRSNTPRIPKSNRPPANQADDVDDQDLIGDDADGDGDVAANTKRINAIRQACRTREVINGRSVVRHHPEIEAEAIEANWSPTQAANAVAARSLYASLPQGMFNASSGGRDRDMAKPSELLTAGLMIHAGRSDLAEKTFGEQTAQQATDLRCRSLMDLCAASLRLEHAAVPRGDSEMIRASFSTVSLPTALGNFADKISADAFSETPAIWTKICRRRSVANFREHKIIRVMLVGSFEGMTNGGELKHGTLEEGTKSVQADTKGLMLGLTRKDIINDDLGMMNDTSEALGRGAARTMNDDFIGCLLANAGSFFHADNSNLVDDILDAAGLSGAIAAMQKRRDSKNRNIDVRAKSLLVPPELEYTALQLLKSAEVQRYTSNAKDNQPTGNPLSSALELLSEARLSNTEAFPTGSATGWYLFGAPNTGAINVALLNGRATPVIEQTDAPFNTLGVLFRGYMDYGFSLGEPAAAHKSTGDAA